MRILTTETEPGLGDAAVERLEQAGHEVLRCHEPGHPTGPCVGLVHDDCPLDRPGGVDVVLAVRSAGHPGPEVTEQGVTCALRRHIPLVLDGPAWPDPFARWVVASTGGGATDEAEACAEAAGRGLAQLGDAVAIATCRLLGGGRKPGVDVRADVHRDGHELRVTVHRPWRESAFDGAIAVHAAAALRDAGAQARSIGVTCTD
jgi:hypothetical protein